MNRDEFGLFGECKLRVLRFKSSIKVGLPFIPKIRAE